MSNLRPELVALYGRIECSAGYIMELRREIELLVAGQIEAEHKNHIPIIIDGSQFCMNCQFGPDMDYRKLAVERLGGMKLLKAALDAGKGQE